MHLSSFQEILENPLQLKHVTRLLIRRVLGDGIQSKVKALPLPSYLKNYVLLCDVLNIES